MQKVEEIECGRIIEKQSLVPNWLAYCEVLQREPLRRIISVVYYE